MAQALFITIDAEVASVHALDQSYKLLDLKTDTLVHTAEALIAAADAALKEPVTGTSVTYKEGFHTKIAFFDVAGEIDAKLEIKTV